MEKYFYLMPRQSGKTFTAINKFNENPTNSLLIVSDYLVNNIKTQIINNKENILSNEKLIKLNNKKYTNIILDEYLSFNNKKIIYKKINEINPDNLFIYTTPTKMYNKKIFEFIKKNKSKYDYQFILELIKTKFECNLFINSKNKLINKCIKEIDKDIFDLYYNFLTDKDVNLIKSFKTFNNSADLKHKIGKYLYNIEYKNKFLF